MNTDGVLNRIDTQQQRWDRRHALAQHPGTVAEVLLRNQHLLPPQGRALDLACGRGANSLYLAAQGLVVDAWDFSAVAIKRLQQLAQDQDLPVSTQIRDVVAHPPQADSFDLILVTHFLQRDLLPALIDALRPGGRIYYQTFVQHVNLERGPEQSEWRLQPNELLHLCKDLQLLYYREEGLAGAQVSTHSDLAMLVAMKP